MPRLLTLVVGPRPTHPLFKDLTGRVFARLAVLDYAGRFGVAHAFYCRCECGAELAVRSTCLTLGYTRSCGCLLATRNRDRLITHGQSQSREWRIWAGMKNRCYNAKVKSYPRYGGRGIYVCDRWLSGDGDLGGFACFLADMGPRPSEGHTVERNDNDGPYSPGNCRWATHSEQNRNTRLTRRLEFGGRTRSVWEWQEITGVAATEINKRIGRGWSVDRALWQPMRRRAA